MSLKRKLNLVLFGLFLSLIAAELLLRLGGFIYLSLQDRRNSSFSRHPGSYRILCIGESTTAMGGEYSYPAQLENILNQRSSGLKFSVVNKGIPGVTIESILASLEQNLDKYKPDMVVAMMGINNAMDERLSGNYIIDLIKGLRIYKCFDLLRLRFFGSPGIIYVKLGEYYNEIQEYQRAESSFRKSIELSAANSRAYLGLGTCYQGQLKYLQAEEMFKKAIELDPKGIDGYIALGWCYADQAKYPQAQEVFNSGMQMLPLSDAAYLEAARYYSSIKDYPRAEELFKRAILIGGKEKAYAWIYIELGECYNDQGRPEEAEEMFKKALAIDKDNHLALRCLARLNAAKGKNAYARVYLKEAKDAEYKNRQYNSLIRSNFLKLKNILNRRNIKLICVQYPMRSLKPLEALFDSAKGVSFVDNEASFRKATREYGYDEYFSDRFAGDFGHCSAKGNYLLASNIADAITVAIKE